MPRGPAPQWRARKPPVVDDHVLASVNAVGGLGKHHPETGHYGTLYLRGFSDRGEAEEWKRALYRCAHYLARNGLAPVSMSAKIVRKGSKYEIEFRAVDKTIAKAHVLAKYGTDRSKWPYDPRRRGAS